MILGVDSSEIACGFVLQQLDSKGQCRIARFGSIAWSNVELHYSQAKIKLRGLWRALHFTQIYLVGLEHFIVEMDAKYIRGMINHPNVHPNASVNRWIAAILMFHFTLVHVPAERFKGPDGLSQRERTEDVEDIPDKDAEDWIDEEVLGCTVWISSFFQGEVAGIASNIVHVREDTGALSLTFPTTQETNNLPRTKESCRHDDQLDTI